MFTLLHSILSSSRSCVLLEASHMPEAPVQISLRPAAASCGQLQVECDTSSSGQSYTPRSHWSITLPLAPRVLPRMDTALMEFGSLRGDGNFGSSMQQPNLALFLYVAEIHGDLISLSLAAAFAVWICPGFGFFPGLCSWRLRNCI